MRHRIKDKKGHTVLDLLGDRDEKLRKLIRKSQAMASISRDDMENGTSRQVFTQCFLLPPT